MIWKIQTQLLSLLLIFVLAIIFLIFFNYKLKKASPTKKPQGFLLICEMFVQTVDNFVTDNLNKKWAKNFSAYIGALTFLIFFGTIIGILGLSSITSSLSVTLTLGVLTFVMYNITAIKHQKWKFLNRFVEPIFVFLPINIIAIWSPLISISVRLFANILAGTIIIALVYNALNFITASFLPFNLFGILIGPFLHAYFDLFAGLIQTIVFASLTIIYIQQEMNTS